MRSVIAVWALPLAAASLESRSLEKTCTDDNVKAHVKLPDGLSLKSVTAQPGYNYTPEKGQFTLPNGSHNYCNVSLVYTHPKVGDNVFLNIYLPEEQNFKNRWLSTGGGGYHIEKGSGRSLEGLSYGAAAGLTDGGYGGDIMKAQPLKNGTSNDFAVKMHGYLAHHELALIGKSLTASYFNVPHVHSYYLGCSEGGREGLSQLQRADPSYSSEFDGAVIGAPAMRLANQGPLTLYYNLLVRKFGYTPPQCELDKINELAIAACDEYDGRKDGVIARSDLCHLKFDLNSTVGKDYECKATDSTPYQKGKVSQKAADIVASFHSGITDDEGHPFYLPYQTGATIAGTYYDHENERWDVQIQQLGGEWVTRFLDLVQVENLSNLDNVTFNTLRDWSVQGWHKYGYTLQTNNPHFANLDKVLNATSNSTESMYTLGNHTKIIQVHGEQDPLIPTASTVRYYEEVSQTLFPNMTYNNAITALQAFWRLYLIPGGLHCKIGDAQPGPWPYTAFDQVIEWVEKQEAPEQLKALGPKDDWTLCKYPLRPKWIGKGKLLCIYDPEGLKTFQHNLTAYDEILY